VDLLKISPSLGHPAGAFFVGVHAVLELLVAQKGRWGCSPRRLGSGHAAIR